MRRVIIGGRTGGCRDQCPIADQLLHPHPTIDIDPQFGGLGPFPQDADLIDRQVFLDHPIASRRRHMQGMNGRFLGDGQPFDQTILIIAIHQESNGPAIHPVNRQIAILQRMQRLQHEAITTQSDHNASLIQRRVTVAFQKPC